MRQVENPEIFRENISKKLNTFLKHEKNARNLERGIYNYALKEAGNHKIVKKWDNPLFVQIYVDHLRSIYFNLDQPGLLESVKTGAIRAHSIAFMTHQELRPDKWEKLIQDKIKRDKNKYETNIEAATDTFTCRKCRQNKCTFYQLQTRSADEPMTTFVQCLTCGNRWKC